MANMTAIEWTEVTWNPVTGCDRVSAGCDHCYALTLAKRLKAMGNPRYQNDGNPKTSGPGFGVTLHRDKLDEPHRWRTPRRIFVNSMSDLFHADVPDVFIDDVFQTMALSPQHTFQILTKRPQRMYRYVSKVVDRLVPRGPLPNVWLGTSVENQEAAYRIDWLVKTPAAVRFLSCEPLLGPLDLRHWLPVPIAPNLAAWGRLCDETGCPNLARCERPGREFDTPIHECPLHAERLDWIIAGGESGPRFRPLDLDWARELRDQCVAAGVPYFFKQVGGIRPKAGGRELDGRTWDQMPAGQGVLI